MPCPGSIACPKPEKRKTVKGRAKRKEAEWAKVVRAFCAVRDGLRCRLQMGGQFWMEDVRSHNEWCDGPSEWAHMHSRRRAQTRNQAPEVRHDTKHSLMLCRLHHGDYDAHRLKITALTRKVADGPLKFTRAK